MTAKHSQRGERSWRNDSGKKKNNPNCKGKNSQLACGGTEVHILWVNKGPQRLPLRHCQSTGGGQRGEEVDTYP